MTIIDLGFLTQAQALNESVLIDRAKVYRDPEGTTDDELDGDFEYPTTSDETLIYGGSDGAPCLVGTDRRREGRGSEGGQSVIRGGHRIRFAVSAPVFQVGDIVLMVASPEPRSNAQLVDRRFRIVEVDVRSIAAGRIIYAEDEWGDRAR